MNLREKQAIHVTKVETVREYEVTEQGAYKVK